MPNLSTEWLRARALFSAKVSLTLGLLFAAGSVAWADQPLVIQKQGSFMAGGVVVTTPGVFNPMSPAAGGVGQTLSGDHTYVQFNIPQGAARQNSALMWGSFVGNSWETTPDGREGFQQIFLRRNWSVYVADRPRMGRSARTTPRRRNGCCPADPPCRRGGSRSARAPSA